VRAIVSVCVLSFCRHTRIHILHTHIYTHTTAHTHTYIYVVRVFVCVYVYTCVRVRVCVCVRARMCVHVYLCAFVCVQMYIVKLPITVNVIKVRKNPLTHTHRTQHACIHVPTLILYTHRILRCTLLDSLFMYSRSLWCFPFTYDTPRAGVGTNRWHTAAHEVV